MLGQEVWCSAECKAEALIVIVLAVAFGSPPLQCPGSRNGN